MTKEEMIGYLVDVVFRRTDVTVDGVESGVSLAEHALKRAHHEIQSDGDWHICEKSEELLFPSTATEGASVPSDYRSARRLLLLDEEGGSVIGEIQSSTEGEVQDIRRERSQASAFTSLQDLHNRWFIKALTIHLMLLPATGEDPIATQLEYWRYLDYYATDDAEDRFSYLWPYMLIEKASEIGFRSLYQDERANLHKALYAEQFAKAQDRERRDKRGGTHRVHSPPLPGSGRR